VGMEESESLAQRIARWVGSGKVGPPPGRTGSPTRAIERRRILFEQIGDFLFEHDLELTPLSFSLAQDYLTENNHRIASAVRHRLRMESPITDSWAEALVAREHQAALNADALSEMIEQIEANLGDVAKVIDRSQVSTTGYGKALAGAAEDLPDATNGADGLVKLLALTEAMIRETRDVEQELRQQQKQVQLLEKNLASARHAAEHDHLTGLPNRRAFEARLAEDARTARQAGEPLTLAFCDIDHFKIVNDTHGHETGDRVLQLVAEALREISPDRCHVARHGGEEFVMLFRNLDAKQVFEIVDGARIALSHRKLVNKVNNQALPTVTFSAGIADTLAYPDPRAALKAADQALYIAKTFGRNQVRVATE
jgi:diguanylate cyclase